MASKIKVDQIEGSTASTITLPSGQTLDLSSGSLTLPDGAVDLSTAKVTGTIPVSKGGTGVTSLGTANQVLGVNSGATALEFQNASSGSIGQVLSTTKTNAFTASVAGSGEASVTDLSVTVTPNSASSKFIIWYSIQTAQASGAWQYAFVKRGITKIGVGDQIGSSRNRVSTFGYHGDNGSGDSNNNQAFQVLDEPNTTSAITYQVFIANGSSGTTTMYVNGNSSGDTASRATFASTITVMEVLA
jgi:hypothetical protein